jgi:hypothetical protein
MLAPNGAGQTHNIFPAGDVDYVKIALDQGDRLTIMTSALQGGLDSTLTLYGVDGQTILAYSDDYVEDPPASRIVWTAPAEGTYFVKAASFDPEVNGCDMSYLLTAWRTPAGMPGPYQIWFPVLTE